MAFIFLFLFFSAFQCFLQYEKKIIGNDVETVENMLEKGMEQGESGGFIKAVRSGLGHSGS